MREQILEENENFNVNEKNRIRARLKKISKPIWRISGGSVKKLAEIISQHPENSYNRFRKQKNYDRIRAPKGLKN